MSESGWRNVAFILAIVCALLLGVSAAFILQPGGGPGATAAASATNEEPQATDTAAATLVATAEPTLTATPSPTASPTKKPTPSPEPTPSDLVATVSFKDLMLDAQQDPQHTSRTFTFTSDGWGAVSVHVVKTSPQGTTKLCASVDGSAPDCRTGALPGFDGKADTAHSTWTVTLLGVDIATPTVDVTFSWHAKTPSIRFTHGRFQGDGAASEALRGFRATFVTRKSGTAGVQASWTTIQTTADLTLADASSSPIVPVDEKQWPQAQQINWSHGVSAGKTYQVQLVNLSADQYRPDLTATITFP